MAVKDLQPQAWTHLLLLLTEVTRPAHLATAFRFVHSFGEVEAGPLPVGDVVDTTALRLKEQHNSFPFTEGVRVTIMLPYSGPRSKLFCKLHLCPSSAGHCTS